MNGILKINAKSHGLHQQLNDVTLNTVLEKASKYIIEKGLEVYYVHFEEYQVHDNEDYMINRDLTKLVENFGKLHTEEIH